RSRFGLVSRSPPRSAQYELERPGEGKTSLGQAQLQTSAGRCRRLTAIRRREGMAREHARGLRVERLEDRLVQSGAANTVAVGQGTISATGAVALVSLDVPASRLVQGRPSTIFGISAQAAPGSELLPEVVSAHGPGLQRLPL